MLKSRLSAHLLRLDLLAVSISDAYFVLVSSGHIGGSDHSSEGSQQAGDEIWVGRPVKIRGLREFREGVGCGVWGVGTRSEGCVSCVSLRVQRFRLYGVGSR